MPFGNRKLSQTAAAASYGLIIDEPICRLVFL
jgi:hypothetical protein